MTQFFTKTLLFFASIIFCHELGAQVKGCTDPQALNYKLNATQNDGTCTYKQMFFSPIKLCSKLSDSLSESSGLAIIDNQFWSHNDSYNPSIIYMFDSLTGTIKHSVFIRNYPNTDWEDITQDNKYIYIGNFGNNGGSRKDLSILKIKKSDINLSTSIDTVNADIIRFSMGDQTDFKDTFISNNYDMEAFLYFNDSLHLFSKNWVDKQSRHYVCPTDTGNHVLMPVETIDVGGQISGATINANGVVALIGYTKPLYPCFIWLCWDHQNLRLNSGNRRKIDLGTTLYPGQIEGVAMRGNTIYITNENKVAVQQLLKLDMSKWIDNNPNNSIGDTFIARTVVSYSNGKLNIQSIDIRNGMKLKIYDINQKEVYNSEFKSIESSSNESFDISQLAKGMYIIKCERVTLDKIVIN